MTWLAAAEPQQQRSRFWSMAQPRPVLAFAVILRDQLCGFRRFHHTDGIDFSLTFWLWVWFAVQLSMLSWNITGTRIHMANRGSEPWAQGSLIPGSNYSAQVKINLFCIRRLNRHPHMPILKIMLIFLFLQDDHSQVQVPGL
jgi:hypothetical protein